MSSTYLVFRCQFLSRSFIIMEKSLVPSLVPCDTPPLEWAQGEQETTNSHHLGSVCQESFYPDT